MHGLMTTATGIAMASLVSISAAGYNDAAPDGSDAGNAAAARAAMRDSSGRTVGEAVLTQTPNGVLLKVDLRGVEAGVHAIHIHQTGRCDPPTFESANGHFAPDTNEHGFLDERGPHAGDLPNIHVPESGSVSFEYLVDRVTLHGGRPGSLLDADGAALVMHAEPDDYQTDPAGAAGDRLVCGVIMR